MRNTVTVKDTKEIRQQIVDVCLLLNKTDYFVGTWGNISVRTDEGFLVTPSAIDYQDQTLEDIVLVSETGNILKGSCIPSSETIMHLELLKKRSDMGAIIHAHCKYLSVLACAHKDLPVIVEDMAQIIGGPVACAPYTPGGRHTDLAKVTCDYIRDDSIAVMLANHGVVVGGTNLKEALTALQVLEKAAAIYIEAKAIGGCVKIPQAELKEERDRYLYKYGKEDVTKG